MGRTTVYNGGLVTDEKWEKVLKDNKNLLNDFIDYCRAQDKSPQTIYQYESQLKIVMCYIMENIDNKFFCDIKKREWVRFVSYLVNDLGLSSNRVSSIKSAISSFSNYIENILDDEYDYRNIIKSIPTPVKEVTREKSVFELEQIKEVLQILADQGKYEIACFLALLISCGCRKAEAIQMKVDFFTDKNLTLENKFWLTPAIRCKGRGKQGKLLKKFVIVDMFKPYLDMWLKQCEEKGIKSEWLFPIFKDGNYVCASISTANSWVNTISKITLEKYGMDYYAHSSRHGFVTFLAKSGYPDAIITKIVGWAKGSNLIGVYNDMTDDEELEGFFATFGKGD